METYLREKNFKELYAKYTLNVPSVHSDTTLSQYK